MKNINLPQRFSWKASGPLVFPVSDSRHSIISIKDPSIVRAEGQWHLFATTADKAGTWNMVYLSFSNWPQAASTKPIYLDCNPYLRGYHCAPQVFYFSPHKKWYMVFQSGQPQYSTSDGVDKPEAWTLPADFFHSVIDNAVSEVWLDFWVICDRKNAYLFFTGDNGCFYRSQTKIDNFPDGMSRPVVAIQAANSADLYEGGATYRLKGMDQYLTLIEAIGPEGRRYYKSFIADTLDGQWRAMADSWENPFAGMNNVHFEDGVEPWTQDFSHGELIRDGYDETLTIDPEHLKFLFQGRDPLSDGMTYSQLPYRLGLLQMEKSVKTGPWYNG
jgi:hypothetical protein